MTFPYAGCISCLPGVLKVVLACTTPTSGLVQISERDSLLRRVSQLEKQAADASKGDSNRLVSSYVSRFARI